MTSNLFDRAKSLFTQKRGQNVPHLIIRALAGTGKSTTIIEGAKRMLCAPRETWMDIVPSPQQEAIWGHMCLSGDVQSCGFAAFNKSIATVLQSRVPQGCNASTMHSMGLKAISRRHKVKVDQYRVNTIVSTLLGMDSREARRQQGDLLGEVRELVALCKMNLVGYEPGSDTLEISREDLEKLANEYDLTVDDERTYSLVPLVLEACKNVEEDGLIDFDDMIWLPTVLGLPLYKYDVLLVDECQDLSRAQQALAFASGRRLICVGDANQAVYGFAGADSSSMDTLYRMLSATPAGCVELPLTVTRRCGRAIVREAQAYVSDFEAHPDNGDGLVSQSRLSAGEEDCLPTYHDQVQDGDLVICRTNAPLVGQCLKFIASGRKANVVGRNIAGNLTKLAKKLLAASEVRIKYVTRNEEDPVHRHHQTQPMVAFRYALDEWLTKETTRERAARNPSPAKLANLYDQHACMSTFLQDVDNPYDVLDRINSVFAQTDDTGEVRQGIRLSSIHRAKGLESHRVFFIRNKFAPCPHPMAKTPAAREQEFNLLYVGVTRAIEHLVWVV